MLDGSRSITWEANVVRGDESMDGLPVELGGSLSWNAAQMVELSGSIRVVLADPQGVSRAPVGPSDLFAPFGSEVMLSARVAVGDMIERVQVARARIVKVPAAQVERQRVNGEWVTLAEVLSLDLRDRMEPLLADEFESDVPIRHSASAWAELEHLSPFPVIRSGDDATLPTALVHTKSRAEAVQQVAQRLGGVAAFDSLGNLIVRRPATATSLTLTLGPNGTVTEVGSVMDATGVYNRVVVRGKRPDGSAIQVERTATGALDPAVWGRRTYVADQGEFLTTVEAAADFADRLLARVSTIRTSELEVLCLLDPRMELGDIASVEWSGNVERIAAEKITYSGPMMTVTGRVL